MFVVLDLFPGSVYLTEGVWSLTIPVYFFKVTGDSEDSGGNLKLYCLPTLGFIKPYHRHCVRDKSQERERAVEMEYLRNACGVPWRVRWSIERVLKQFGVEVYVIGMVKRSTLHLSQYIAIIHMNQNIYSSRNLPNEQLIKYDVCYGNSPSSFVHYLLIDS